MSTYTPLTRIWSVVNSMSGNSRPVRPFEALALHKGKSMTCLAEDFVDVYSAGKAGNLTTPVGATPTCPLDAPFTLRELQTALSALRPRCAAGPDRITNLMLRNLPTERLGGLLDLFNEVWATGDIPVAWLTAWVVPVLKPGKDRTALISYRPVSLTSCVAKLMEKMIHARLAWWVESRRHLPDCMTGFRPRLSAQDSILDLVSHIEHHRADGLSTLAVFLDVSKAYDCLLPEAILRELQSMQVTGRLLQFVEKFLCERQTQVRLGKVLSSSRSMSRGCRKVACCHRCSSTLPCPVFQKRCQNSARRSGCRCTPTISACGCLDIKQSGWQ